MTKNDQNKVVYLSISEFAKKYTCFTEHGFRSLIKRNAALRKACVRKIEGSGRILINEKKCIDFIENSILK